MLLQTQLESLLKDQVELIKNFTTQQSIKYFLFKASFFKQFRLFAESYDFNIEKINQEKSIQLRQRKGLSIDECARLCMLELAFRCEAVTYEPILKECKWSSIISEFFSDIDKNIYVEKKEGYFVYTSKNSMKKPSLRNKFI